MTKRAAFALALALVSIESGYQRGREALSSLDGKENLRRQGARAEPSA